MTVMNARKRQLETRLADLQRRLSGIEATLEQPHSTDWEEMAVEREGEEVLETMGLSGQHEIRVIEAALGRIAEGSYGFCAKCGLTIAEERLDALPFTPFCRACAV